jgi:hypothetical protein
MTESPLYALLAHGKVVENLISICGRKGYGDYYEMSKMSKK